MTQKRIPVLTSLYHTDLWPEFLDIFIRNKNHIIPVMGLCEDHNNNFIIKDLNRYFNDYEVSICKNAGADVMPFLIMLNKLTDKFPYFIKIHAKKSSWGIRNHVNWRQILISDLLDNPDLLMRNIRMLANNRTGMVSNQFLCLSNREHTNTQQIKHICNLINIDYEKVKNSSFPAGNMFMSKTAMFKKFFTPTVIEKLVELLSKEKGKISDTLKGSYSHGLERIFGYIVKYENKKIAPPIHKTIKIFNNQKDKTHTFHLVLINNNKNCYLQEDVNIYGSVLSNNDDHAIIYWHHLSSPVKVLYKKISLKAMFKYKIL